VILRDRARRLAVLAVVSVLVSAVVSGVVRSAADSAAAAAAAAVCAPVDAFGHWLVSAADAGGVNDAGDDFGGAVTSGDFDGDGFADVAVGAPRDAVSGVRAGAVYPYSFYEFMPTPLWAFFRAPPTTTDPQILFKVGNRKIYATFDVDATVSPPRLTVEYLDTTTNESLYRTTLTPNDILPP
jgi:FG-GAP repeat